MRGGSEDITSEWIDVAQQFLAKRKKAYRTEIEARLLILKARNYFTDIAFQSWAQVHCELAPASAATYARQAAGFLKFKKLGRGIEGFNPYALSVSCYERIERTCLTVDVKEQLLDSATGVRDRTVRFDGVRAITDTIRPTRLSKKNHARVSRKVLDTIAEYPECLERIRQILLEEGLSGAIVVGSARTNILNHTMPTTAHVVGRRGLHPRH